MCREKKPKLSSVLASRTPAIKEPDKDDIADQIILLIRLYW